MTTSESRKDCFEVILECSTGTSFRMLKTVSHNYGSCSGHNSYIQVKAMMTWDANKVSYNVN